VNGDGSTPEEERFWRHAAPLLDRRDVTRSTMMGLPCLRVRGAFFASFDRRTGDLLVKLREERVHELVESGRATNFAPAGRTFREWAAVPPARVRSWPKLLEEALEFVRTASVR
jgi:hypothetical protein